MAKIHEHTFAIGDRFVAKHEGTAYIVQVGQLGEDRLAFGFVEPEGYVPDEEYCVKDNPGVVRSLTSATRAVRGLDPSAIVNGWTFWTPEGEMTEGEAAPEPKKRGRRPNPPAVEEEETEEEEEPVEVSI